VRRIDLGIEVKTQGKRAGMTIVTESVASNRAENQDAMDTGKRLHTAKVGEYGLTSRVASTHDASSFVPQPVLCRKVF
jgi:hypothetical protein